MCVVVFFFNVQFLFLSANENTRAEIIKHFPQNISPSSAPKIHALSSLLWRCSGESFHSPVLDIWESGAVVMIITSVGCSKALLEDLLTQVKIEHSNEMFFKNELWPPDHSETIKISPDVFTESRAKLQRTPFQLNLLSICAT